MLPIDLFSQGKIPKTITAKGYKFKEYSEFNEAGKEVFHRYIGKSWLKGFEIEANEYDSLNRLIRICSVNPSGWMMSVYKYDEDTLKVCDFECYDLEKKIKISRKINSQQALIKHLLFQKEKNQLPVRCRYTIVEVDSTSGKILKEEGYSEYDTSRYLNSSKDYYYDNSGKLIFTEEYIPNSRCKIEQFEDEKNTKSILYSLNGYTGGADTTKVKSYIYHENGTLKEELHCDYIQFKKVLRPFNSKLKYYYNEKGELIKKEYFLDDDGEIRVDGYLFYYNENGGCVLEKRIGFKSSKKYRYTYW